MGGIMAYLILSVSILSDAYKDYTPGEIAQLISNYSFKFQYLLYFFTRLYDTLNEISVIGGNAFRVGELFDNMQKQRYTETRSTDVPNSVLADNTCLILEKVSIKIPSKFGDKILIKDLDLKFQKNKNILITGKSGCGKTSLFRCISGLWTYGSSYSGKIIINKKYLANNKIFFLPQNSYFTSGCLLEQIIYPTYIEKDSDSTSINESEIIEWLKLFNLEHLLEKVNNDLYLKPSFFWTNILSGGEQQRLSFLRILFHKPEFALLDEFTSAVDQTTETLMYESLNRIGCTYMSIAHRDTVRLFHNLEIKLNNDSYEIIDLNN